MKAVSAGISTKDKLFAFSDSAVNTSGIAGANYAFAYIEEQPESTTGQLPRSRPAKERRMQKTLHLMPTCKMASWIC